MGGFSRKQLITIIILLVALIIIPVSVMFIHSQINSATINVIIAPASSKILLDNKDIISNGEIKTTPGTHTISAEKDGFTTQSTTVEAKKGETTTVTMVLESNSDATANWYSENADDASVIESIVGAEVTAGMEEQLEDSPIVNILPKITTAYRIDYGVCEEDVFCVSIQSNYNNFSAPISYLKENSIDLGQYLYVYKNYVNPFSSLTTSKVSSSVQNVSSSERNNVSIFLDDLFKNYNNSVRRIEFRNNFILASVIIFDDYSTENTFNMILQKVDNNYKLITTPDFVLTYKNNPDIPKEIIDAVNKL